MTRTPNHGYNVPKEGAQDWHEPLNENFERYDTDIELRDEAANRDDYEPKDGAKFLATDTGVVHVGDGSEWIPAFQVGRYTAPSDASNTGGVAFGDPDNDASGDGATISGGTGNVAGGERATVGGGATNRARDEYATIGGGYFNRATGDGATIPGGRRNVASADYSFAAGRKAEAHGEGTFVWNNSDDGFRVGGDDQFVVNSVGGVGVGTAPDAPLHVGATDDPAMDGDFKVGSSDHRLWVDVTTDGMHSGSVRVRARGENSVGVHNLYLGAGSEDVAHVRGSGGGVDYPGLFPADHEEAALGVDTRRWRRLHSALVFADIIGADIIKETSDARLKRNVSRLDGGLETVGDLRPVSYEWEDEDRGDGTQLGLIAQEVQEVLPEVVERQERDGDDEDGYLAVQYTKFVPVLIDAVQRQQEGIEERDERIEELEAESDAKDERIDDLEERLASLEAHVDHDAGTVPADD